jgi:hypothetical protein
MICTLFAQRPIMPLWFIVIAFGLQAAISKTIAIDEEM